ncbi:MAG: hypothetical protein KDD82_18750 [Planctomycetes bacterium]|nr:hypothetical protein [Planctomycetota bacterium]
MRGLGWTWAVAALLGVGQAAAGDGVWLRVEQNGVFGGGPPREVEVAATGDLVRLLDRAAQRTLYVDRAAREVVEVDLVRGEYVRKPFAAYAGLRRERAARRQEQLARIAALREAAADEGERAALDARLREQGLRLDGEERVTREELPPRPFFVTLGHVPQPVLCTPTCLRVNQAREPVASLQVATRLELRVQPLDVYLELGILPEALEQALRALEGTVLSGELLLDDGSLKKRIRFRALEVRSGVDVGDLRPPLGLTQVEELGAETREEPRGEVCLRCGGPLGKTRVTLAGRPFCSRQHRQAYAREHARER